MDATNPMSVDEIAAARSRYDEFWFINDAGVTGDGYWKALYATKADIPRLLATIAERDERIAALEKLGERFASILDHEGDHFGAEEVRAFLGAKEPSHG